MVNSYLCRIILHLIRTWRCRCFANFTKWSFGWNGTKYCFAEGSGHVKGRQDSGHAHSTTFSPDGKYLYASDLGNDKVYAFVTTQVSLNHLKRTRAEMWVLSMVLVHVIWSFHQMVNRHTLPRKCEVKLWRLTYKMAIWKSRWAKTSSRR